MQPIKLTTLPYSHCRGSEAQRRQLCEKMLKKTFELLNAELEKSSEIDVIQIRKCIKKVLPRKNIILSVSENNQNENYLNYIIDNDDKIKGYYISLMPNSNGKFDNRYLNTILHEIWHLFELITNPKIGARFNNIDREDLKIYYSFYTKYIYSENIIGSKKIRSLLKEFMDRFREKDKINILQHMRYDLKGEKDAYDMANKYAWDGCYYCGFDRKLRILNRELKKQIDVRRKNVCKE